ncbi:Helix-turn-helix domain-containing protein [Streptomyces sp. 2131.1]|uniref:helix-turn-helix transcriptional regulator n=1 Tax=Streptomyces sp. 2131.1 TaxID=1855346 RepID=UPI000896A4FB|nr:helix-turn-helix domain-containing protein [Streptomyces sp. 2131.1]SEC57389.1 Helix-turn-helix domain-containing protein [Streptomyces sp. 2131.1]
MRYLTTAEVAERYRTAESTVRYWRQLKKGPRGIKVGKRVLYPETELLRYERALADGGDEWGLAS